MNDDDFVNTSPHETLSDFWANRYSQSDKPKPCKGDFSQRNYRIPSKSEKHEVNSRHHFQLLDHHAAKHKIACRPKRNHPHPRKKKLDLTDLNTPKKDLELVATVHKFCGREISSLQHNSIHVVSPANMKVGTVNNFDTSKSDKTSKSAKMARFRGAISSE